MNAQSASSAQCLITLHLVCSQAREFFEDDFGCLGPNEGVGLTVVFADVAADRFFYIGDIFELPPANFPPRDDGKETLDGFAARGRCRHEVEDAARACQVVGANFPETG